MPNTPSPHPALTLKVNGTLVRFPSNEAALVELLLKAQEQSTTRPELTPLKEAQEAVWGETTAKTRAALSVLVHSINTRVPDLIIRSSFEPGLYLTRRLIIMRSQKELPQPRRGRKAGSVPPTIMIQADGHPHKGFHGRAATVLRLLFNDRLAFRTTSEIMAALGLDPTKRAAADRAVASLRSRIPELIQTGRRNQGWRLNPQIRAFVVWDAGPG